MRFDRALYRKLTHVVINTDTNQKNTLVLFYILNWYGRCSLPCLHYLVGPWKHVAGHGLHWLYYVSESTITKSAWRFSNIILHPIPQADICGIPAKFSPWHDEDWLMSGWLRCTLVERCVVHVDSRPTYVPATQRQGNLLTYLTFLSASRMAKFNLKYKIP